MRRTTYFGFECLDCLKRHVGFTSYYRARLHGWHRGHPMALGAGAVGNSVAEVREKLVEMRAARFQRMREYQEWHRAS